MDSKQLLDSLTSHIALYHSSLSSSPSPFSLSKNPRNSILRWFSSLSIPHRQASLTVVDHKFAQILLKMRNRIQSNGHGSFILLPDLPSRYSLPSLCFRKSRGLLSRSAAASASDRSIYDSIRLFSSGSSEKCGCSLGDVDSCTFSEEFVADIDRFVEAMDLVSDGGFLRGEEKDLGSDWFEFSWLKAKGYYGLEAFVANKLELALRLSWINFNCAKRRGPKRKEKAAGAAGVAANVFWRKKGCLDWWDGLDPGVRKKILRTFLGKTAKSLANEIVKEANDVSRDEVWFFSVGLEQPVRYEPTASRQRTDADFFSGIVPASVSVHPTSLANVSSSLLVLQQISVIILACDNFNYESDKLFFSTLDSLHTVSDCILRRVHMFLTKLSSDYTNLELLGDENLKASANKSKGRTKGRGRKLKKHNPLRKSLEPEELPEENRCGLDNEEENSSRRGYINDNVSMEVATTTLSAEKGFCQSTSLSGSMMELLEEVVNGKVETTTIRSGKEYPKHNKSHCQGVGDGAQDHSIMGTTTSVTSLCGLPASYELPDVSTSLSQSNDFCFCDNPPPNSGDCEPAEKPRLEVHTAVTNGIEDDPVIVCSPPEVRANKGLEHHNPNTSDSSLRSGSPKLNEVVDNDVTSLVQEKEPKDYYTHGPPSFLGGISYEWPNLAPAVYFPSVNSRHLPTATDRLHLDVGHNWQNHLHQPFLPMGRQPRNTLVEAGFSRMLPSHTLPVSLDWPLSVDSSDIKTGPDLADDSESSHWTTEEECEVRAISCRDYNQFFGGGIMYWNTSDHGGTGFSGPPSLSSEDSSWAWHEADLNRAIDDMVGLSTSYCGKGLASPTSASFCSPFDPMGPTHQPLGYVIPGSDLTVKDVMAEETLPGSLTKSSGGVAEGLTGDSLPYPLLRPIIVPNISRKWSRSEFMLSHDHKSPCVPATRRDPPRIKRPPSPVVLCVPQPPGNPPPSPVGESRKQRGFPGVRSGSSSPRNWGMRSWYHEGTNCEEARICVDGPEVIWSSWRSKGLGPAQMMQPVPGTLPQDCLIAISQLALDQEHPDVALPLHPPDLQNSAARKMSLSMMHNLLHEEIDSFCKQVAAENLIRKPYVNWAVKRVARSLQVLWPRSRTNIFGSNATGLALPTSDVDLVVCLPPVRNLEPIKEAGILEGRNGIKETCLQHAARYLANQEWVKIDSLKTVENTAIPIIMLVAEIPKYLVTSNGNPSIGHITDLESNHVIREQGSVTHRSDNVSWPLGSKMKNSNGMDVKSVRLDISFKSPSHTGLQTTELVRDLTDQFPAAAPLALILKQFLADRSLDHSYSGGLSSYCLVLLITRFLQHEHHVTRAINQNLGSLLMDFLYFFGNVFDPRQMRISIQGSGIYVNRERGHCIDPIHIDDPLYPTNNVGRNCFRIHQCIKAFADAYAVLDNELAHLPSSVDDPIAKASFKLLPKIIPSINLV